MVVKDRLEFCPEALRGITMLSKHEANGSEAQEGQRLQLRFSQSLAQPSAAVESSDGPFPTTWKRHKTFDVIGRLTISISRSGRVCASLLPKRRSPIAAISKERFQESIHRQRRQKQDAVIAFPDEQLGSNQILTEQARLLARRLGGKAVEQCQ
jgi:hypothetical protein